MHIQKTFFNRGTGEVYGQQEYRDDSDLIMDRDKETFIKLWVRHKVNYRTPVYDSYFHRLLQFLEKNTNRLVYRYTRKDKSVHHAPLLLTDLQKELRLQKTAIYNFLRESKDLCYLLECRMSGVAKGFYVNPLYAQNGRGMTPELYLLFSHDTNFARRLTERDKWKISEYLGGGTHSLE